MKTRTGWSGLWGLSVVAAAIAALTATGCESILGIHDLGGSGSGLGDASSPQMGKAIGDPCSANAECASGACEMSPTGSGLWCTQPCATLQDCGTNSNSVPNACVTTSSGPQCFPTCSVAADCAAFGAGFQCAARRTPDNASGGEVPVCTQAGTGDACMTDTECASGKCQLTGSGQGGWCTQACTTAASCGVSNLGGVNACVATTNGSLCFPECTSRGNCVNYGSFVNCIAHNGTSICTLGAVGDPCSENAECWSGQCALVSGSYGWCTLSCTAAAQCGSTSAGLANACLTTASGAKLCTPTCTGSPQCTAYGYNFACVPAPGGLKICLPTGSAAIGDSCHAGSDCMSGSCQVDSSGQSLWCTTPCTSSAQCGSSSAGNPNACVRFADGNPWCVPECSTAQQCQSFTASSTCVPLSGQAVSACSVN